MNFVLFLLLNAILLIRPEELFPSLAGLRLFFITFTLCIFTSLPGLLELLRPSSWRENPLCPIIFGYLLLYSVSGIPFNGFTDVDNHLTQCFKNGVYFLLFIVTVDTVDRFKILLGSLVTLIVVTITLSVLTYHGFLNLEALRPYVEGLEDPVTGEFVGSVRLRCSGIFSDPNDTCQLLMLGSLSCLALAVLSRKMIIRVLWLLPIGLFMYATTLTLSRGGLLSILAGLTGMILVRLGPKTGLFLAPFIIMGGVLAAGGRQAQFNMENGDTSQERIDLWAQALTLLSQNKMSWLTGTGTGTIAEEFGLVAHNSYVQAYVETGLIGGHYGVVISIPLIAIFRLRQLHELELEPDEQREIRVLSCFVFGFLAGFATCCYSLTRNSAESTYLFLGLGASYLALARGICPKWYKFDSNFMKGCAILGFVVFLLVKMFTVLVAKY